MKRITCLTITVVGLNMQDEDEKGADNYDESEMYNMLDSIESMVVGDVGGVGGGCDLYCIDLVSGEGFGRMGEVMGSSSFC